MRESAFAVAIGANWTCPFALHMSANEDMGGSFRALARVYTICVFGVSGTALRRREFFGVLGGSARVRSPQHLDAHIVNRRST